MPTYKNDGTLTTDKKTGGSFGWDTQTEWEAYQSKTDIEIVNGSVELSSIPASGLAYYPFEQSLNDVWNGNNLSQVGGVGYTTNSYSGGYAVVLDGVDDYMITPIIPTNYSEFSFYARVYPISGTVAIASEYDGTNPFQTLHDDTGTLDWFTGDNLGIVNASVPYTANSWQSYIYTFGPTNGYQVDVDGVNVASSTSTSWSPSTDSLTVGGHNRTARGNFYMDELKMFSKELTQTERDNLHQTGSI